MNLWVCFFFKQKTAYEMRISDWSSDVCSSDLSSRHSRKTVPGGSTLYCSCNMIHRRWANDDHNASATDLIHMQDATTSGRLRRVVPARSQGPEMAEKMAPQGRRRYELRVFDSPTPY